MRVFFILLLGLGLLSLLAHSASSLLPPTHSLLNPAPLSNGSFPAAATFTYYSDSNCSHVDAGPFSLDYHTPPSCVVLDGYSYLINCSEGGGQTGSDKLYFHFLEWTDSLLCEGDNPVSVTYSAPTLSPCAAAESVQNGVVSMVYMTVLCTGGGGGGSSQLSSSSSFLLHLLPVMAVVVVLVSG